MLSALLLIPIIGSLMLLPINEQSPTQSPKKINNFLMAVNSVNGVTRMKQIALTASIVNFILSIVLWGEFDSSSVQYQFVQEFNNLSFCHLNIGIDGISLYFVLLTTFITPLCILANWDNIKFGIKYFLIAFLLMETLLIAVFVVLDLMLFYIFFESVLIPMFLVVGIWGGSVTRIRASFLLFLYTLAGSLFMLLSIMVIYYNVGSTDFAVVSLSELTLNGQQILWLGFFLSFAVKTPLLPVHIWLPRAHAEAPLAGSVLLAGVVLKMATYGYLRILIPMFPDATAYFSPLVQTIAVVSIIYSSLATLRQSDFKALVAYSSVGHMSVVVLGIFSNTIVGIEGAILLSIAHGLISPALFILLGGVLYDKFHTRVIRYYRGMRVYMPMFSIVFFLASAFNIAVPLSLNWLGEFLSLSGMFHKSPIISILGASSIVLSAGYTIFLFNRITFGAYSQYIRSTTDISRREFMLVLPLLVLTVLFGIVPNIILSDIHVAVTNIIYCNPLFTINNEIRVGEYIEEIDGICSIISVNNIKKTKKVNELFNMAYKKDDGSHTNNPYIVVDRLIKRGGFYTLEDLHSVQLLSEVPLISRQDFDTLTKIKGENISLPMSGKRATVLGPAKGENVKRGIYIFTNLINKDTRVGSAQSLGRRITEHFSLKQSKSSSILRKAFNDFKIENFTLTVFFLPAGTSYTALLGLEQYYMLVYNPKYCPLKVVNNPIISRNISFKTIEIDDHKLRLLREKTGTSVYLYNNTGVLLYVTSSIGEFARLFPNTALGRSTHYRHVDKNKFYKQSLLLQSYFNDLVSLPIFNKEQVINYIKSLCDTPFNYSTRKISIKANNIKIIVTRVDDITHNIQNDVIVADSARQIVNKLNAISLRVSRKRIDRIVSRTKLTGNPAISKLGNIVLSLSIP